MLQSGQKSDDVIPGVVSDSDIVSDPNSESTQHSTGTRKLNRVSKAPEEIRSAKLASLKRNRSSASSATKVQKPEDLIGVTLADGRYTVKSQLGKGSMAYVFLAADSRLETDVVVKVPKPEIFTTKDFRERFKRETQLLVKFSHPHVVSVLDIGEFERLPYVVMQLLSGGSLADHMKTKSNAKRQMAPESLKQWLPGVSRALDFCYRKGMVHRDVKPANILFDEDSNPFVADFGLSKVMYGDHADANSSETAAGIVLGTPNYISPEIVLAKNYDGRADQYSLGITVYHALCGKPPMQGNSATATMVNQTQRQLDLLSKVRPDVSERLALVIQKSIEKNPDKRFDCCEAFADAVVDALRIPRKNVSPTVVTEESPPAAPATPRKRKDTTQAKTSSASRRQPAVKSNSSGSRSRQAPNQKDDLDWLNISATTALPPRKSRTQKKARRGKKQTAGLTVFGQQLSTPLAVTFGAALGLLVVLGAVKMLSADGDSVRAVPTAASMATSASSASGVSGVSGGNGSESKAEKQSNVGKGNQKNKRNQKKQAASAPLPTTSVAGANLWVWQSNADNAKPTVSQDGTVVTITPLIEDADENPRELRFKIQRMNSERSWAQAVIKGADFARATHFAEPAAALTKQDLNELQIEFDYKIPDDIEFSVSLQAGPRTEVWTDRALKLTDMLQGSNNGEGHVIINVADAKIKDAAREKFLRAMNGDITRSNFSLKFGIQGRDQDRAPDCEFSVSNLRIIAKR